MKVLSLFVCSGAILAAPATAGVVHQASLAYEGSSLSLTYEPRTRMTFRESGQGPRGTAGCFWTAEVSVERKLADASGRPIEALTRIVGAPMVAKGFEAGHCGHLKRDQSALLNSNSDRMEALLATAAASDQARLQSELASFARGISG